MNTLKPRGKALHRARSAGLPLTAPGASQAVQLDLSYLPGASQAPLGLFLPLLCLPGASQAVQLVLSCIPGASLVPRRLSKLSPFLPPWCLPGCPNSPFLPPWCLPGASQAGQLVFSCLPGASQTVQMGLSCLTGGSLVAQLAALSKFHWRPARAFRCKSQGGPTVVEQFA